MVSECSGRCDASERVAREVEVVKIHENLAAWIGVAESKAIITGTWPCLHWCSPGWRQSRARWAAQRLGEWVLDLTRVLRSVRMISMLSAVEGSSVFGRSG